METELDQLAVVLRDLIPKRQREECTGQDDIWEKKGLQKYLGHALRLQPSGAPYRSPIPGPVTLYKGGDWELEAVAQQPIAAVPPALQQLDAHAIRAATALPLGSYVLSEVWQHMSTKRMHMKLWTWCGSTGSNHVII
eukprot:jgi/Chrzof1/11763/Cz06g09030.t1